MNNADNTQDQGLTTEQIAAAGRAPAQEATPAPAGRPATMTTTSPPSPRMMRYPGTTAAVPRTPAMAAASQLTPDRMPACWMTASCRT
jgi:hypothetical protein